MGEMTFIKDGIATTIHRDGEVSRSAAIQCDSCFKWSDGLGALAIRDVDREILLWLCSECRR